MSNRDRAYLSVALYLARKSTARMKHGALIVKGGAVQGTGYNKSINHPMIVSSRHIRTHCSRHAEREAIRDAGQNLKGAVMYVARINKTGQARNSKPCPACAQAIEQAGIKRVVWTE